MQWKWRAFSITPGGIYTNHYLLRVFLFTYLLTPWSRVLLEKLTVSQLVKKFPAFYGTRRFITASTSARHLSLSWAREIQSMRPHSTSRRSSLILSSHPCLSLPRELFPSSSHQNPVYTSPLPRTCYMPRPSYTSRFDRLKYPTLEISGQVRQDNSDSFSCSDLCVSVSADGVTSTAIPRSPDHQWLCRKAVV